MGVRACTRLVGAATLLLQLAAALAGAMTVCLNTSLTHYGTAALECPEHQASAVPAPPDDHQHHFVLDEGTGSTGSSHLTCRCPADPLSLLIGETAIVSDSGALRVVPAESAMIAALVSPPTNVYPTPVAPPPRPFLS